MENNKCNIIIYYDLYSVFKMSWPYPSANNDLCIYTYVKHSCPSGLRGPSQERLSRDAWVRIPPDAFYIRAFIFTMPYKQEKECQRNNKMYKRRRGNVAQMVERSFRIRKARGSIPLISILKRERERKRRREIGRSIFIPKKERNNERNIM